jgi:hypothetical protein
MMQHIYYLANVSHTLRILEYIHSQRKIAIDFVTVINFMNGWLMRIKMENSPSLQVGGDFKAFLDEMGFAYNPGDDLNMAFQDLERGQSPLEVMKRYQIALVFHGKLQSDEIEAFLEQTLKKGLP